jgi:hypothetical protein
VRRGRAFRTVGWLVCRLIAIPAATRSARRPRSPRPTWAAPVPGRGGCIVSRHDVVPVSWRWPPAPGSCSRCPSSSSRRRARAREAPSWRSVDRRTTPGSVPTWSLTRRERAEGVRRCPRDGDRLRHTPRFWSRHRKALQVTRRVGIGLNTQYDRKSLRIPDWSGYSLPHDLINLGGENRSLRRSPASTCG